jgi:hypothetical protein
MGGGAGDRSHAGQADTEMRRFLKILGALAIIIGSFFGTLYLFDRFDILTQDPVAAEAAALREALEKYRQERSSYPPSQNDPVSVLKQQLVSGGQTKIPDADKDARYVSLDGKSYGMLFHINRSAANPAGTPCLIEVNTKGNNWWSRPPACPF